MKPVALTAPMLPGDVAVGDLWRVASVGAGGVTFERVEAEPGTFRRRGDGLYPDLPDVRPCTDEEAREVTERMDAAMKSGSDFVRFDAPFLPPGEQAAGLQQALDRGWAKPPGGE